MNPTTQTIGEGTRILDFIVDTLVIFIFSFIVYKWWNFYVMYWGFKAYRFGTVFFGFTFVYTFLFEWIFLRTPAKMLTGVKVQSKKGGRPSLGQFLMRAALRSTYLTMFGLAWNDQPFHDTFSRTILVKSKP